MTNMTKPNVHDLFSSFWRVNVGQVITVLVFAGGIIATWSEMGAKLKQVDYRVTQVERAIDEQRAVSTTLATMVVELRLTREQLNDLRADIRRLELMQSSAPRHRELTRPD